MGKFSTALLCLFALLVSWHPAEAKIVTGTSSGQVMVAEPDNPGDSKAGTRGSGIAIIDFSNGKQYMLPGIQKGDTFGAPQVMLPVFDFSGSSASSDSPLTIVMNDAFARAFARFIAAMDTSGTTTSDTSVLLAATDTFLRRLAQFIAANDTSSGGPASGSTFADSITVRSKPGDSVAVFNYASTITSNTGVVRVYNSGESLATFDYSPDSFGQQTVVSKQGDSLAVFDYSDTAGRFRIVRSGPGESIAVYIYNDSARPVLIRSSPGESVAVAVQNVLETGVKLDSGSGGLGSRSDRRFLVEIDSALRDVSIANLVRMRLDSPALFRSVFGESIAVFVVNSRETQSVIVQNVFDTSVGLADDTRFRGVTPERPLFTDTKSPLIGAGASETNLTAIYLALAPDTQQRVTVDSPVDVNTTFADSMSVAGTVTIQGRAGETLAVFDYAPTVVDADNDSIVAKPAGAQERRTMGSDTLGTLIEFFPSPISAQALRVYAETDVLFFSSKSLSFDTLAADPIDAGVPLTISLAVTSGDTFAVRIRNGSSSTGKVRFSFSRW